MLRTIVLLIIAIILQYSDGSSMLIHVHVEIMLIHVHVEIMLIRVQIMYFICSMTVTCVVVLLKGVFQWRI